MTHFLANKQNRVVRRSWQLFILAILLLGTCFSAEAHSVTDIGAYSIIVGWEIEPALVGERNTMYIDLLKDGQLVSAQDSKLNLQLLFGDKVKTVIPTQNPATGRYRVNFIPTVSGDYSFQINGTAGEQAIDVLVTPEPVEEAIALQFPTVALSNVELQQVIVDMETANAELRGRLTVGLALSIFSILFMLIFAVYIVRFRLPKK
ncbi:MAG: hypothetical protein ACPG8W_12870 [Candidatus Promineifilaceae bacterium]